MDLFAPAFGIEGILVLMLILAAAWIGLRLLFRLTLRIFSLGCGAIVFLGLCLLFFQMSSG